MILFEIKKAGSRKTIGLLLIIYLVSCMISYLQFKGVDNVSNTHLSASIYQEVGGRITEKTSQKMEQEKKQLDTILSQEYEMEDKYNKGKIDVDDYMNYRDLYHQYDNKKDAVNYVYERYLTAKEKGLYMVFDSFYNQLFKIKTIQWGLILSIIMLSMLIVNCETKQLLTVLYCTPKGKIGIWSTKLKTVLFISVVFAALYNIAEYGIMTLFSSINQLGAPVQSISCLSSVKISVTIGQWIIVSLILRLIMAAFFGIIVFEILQLIKNRNIGLVIMLMVVVLPIIVAKGFGIDRVDILNRMINVYPMFL